MKKYLVSILALLVLVTMLAIPAMAAGGSAAVSSATGTSGGTVTVAVSLSGFEQATSVGISVSSDLTLSGGEWTLSGGLIAQVLPANNAAAWQANIGQTVTVNGDVLNLTFQLPAYTGVKAYPVTVEVEVKNGSTTVGTASATGTVTVNNPAESVTLDKSTLALDLSGTKTAALTATAAPATTTDTVVWSSSDTSVASVANGTVTALKPGTATITATVGTKSATCAVTVSCSHANAVKVGANAPTCQATGNNAYYNCGDCKQVLASDKNTVTTIADQTLAKVAHSGGTATCAAKAVCSMCQQPYGEKKAHSFAAAWQSNASQHWHICTTCNTEKDSVANHSFTWKVDKAATEDATGLKHEECACGYKRNENTVIGKLDHVHTGITKHNAVAATCVKTGTVEYWTCSSSKCAGKYYGDANCKTELSTITEAINAGNHTGKTELRDKVEATCGKEGYSGDTWCLDCKTVSKKGAAVSATGKHTAKAAYLTDENNHWQGCSVCGTIIGQKTAHSFKWVVDKAATEDATGLKHEECACGYKRNENTVIGKLDHVHTGITKHNAVAATCVKTGTVEYWTCSSSKCAGKYYGDANCQIELSTITEAINAGNHTGKTELRDKVEATCAKEGYSGDTWCLDCKTVSKKGAVVSATGKHTAKAAYLTDENNHWQECSVCGTIIGQKTAHSFKWVVDKAATEDDTGLKHEECACGYKRNENTVIGKLDHVHTGITKHNAVAATCVKTGTVEYWTCSSSKCAGKYYGDANCQIELSTITEAINAGNHTGKTELRDKVEATCAKEGYSGDTWCLDCKTVSKKGAAVSATGKHTAKAAYLTDENNHWQECSVCGTIIGQKTAHSFKWVVDKAATEDDTGLKHEACSVCKLERSKNTAIDKLPHIPTKVEGKAAACEEDGAAEYFYCVNCGAYYASEDGKQGAAINKEDITIAALGHSFGDQWLSDEKGHWNVCAACEAASELEAHTTEVVGAVEATEEAEGYTGDVVCTVCKAVVSQGQTIPVLSVVEPTEAPTETPDDAPAQTPEQPEQKVDISLVIAICLLVLIVVGGGAYLLVKKPWMK